jgi:hypothetical protein
MLLFQKYQHKFGCILGEFNMKAVSLSLQLMDPNCKPVHVHVYTVTRAVKLKGNKARKYHDW